VIWQKIIKMLFILLVGIQIVGCYCLYCAYVIRLTADNNYGSNKESAISAPEDNSIDAYSLYANPGSGFYLFGK